MKKKATPLVHFVILAVALIVTGGLLQSPATATSQAPEVAVSAQPQFVPFLDLWIPEISPAATASCGLEEPKTAGWGNPHISCQCWEGCCWEDTCWRGIILEFCGPD